jgi:copper chaperone
MMSGTWGRVRILRALGREPSTGGSTTMTSTRLKIQGMTCNHCVQAVEKALRNQNGVRNATVHLDSGTAEVQYEEKEVAPEQLVAAVEEEGYAAAIGGNSAGGAR